MKLIDITCPKCNATMQVNEELTQCTCNYCGNTMLIDCKQSSLVDAYKFGYEQEKGRRDAELEFKRNQELEKQRISEEKEKERQRKAEEQALIDKERAKPRFVIAMVFLMGGLAAGIFITTKGVLTCFLSMFLLSGLFFVSLFLDIHHNTVFPFSVGALFCVVCRILYAFYTFFE